MNFKLVKNESKEALVGNRLMYLLAILVVSVVSGALSVAGIGFLIAPVLFAGLFVMGKALLRKDKLDFNDLLLFFKDLNPLLKYLR